MKNVLILVEKPYIAKVLQQVFNKNNQLFQDNYYFDYTVIGFHKEDTIGMQSNGENSYSFAISSLHVPEGYQYYISPHTYKNSELIPKMDEIIATAIPTEMSSVLATTEYIERFGISFDKVKNAVVKNLTKNAIIEAFSNLTDFNNVLEKIQKDDELER